MQLLQQALPSFINSYEIVVRGGAGTFTFGVSATSGAVDRGAGDLHNRTSDRYKSHFDIEIGGTVFKFEARSPHHSFQF